MHKTVTYHHCNLSKKRHRASPNGNTAYDNEIVSNWYRQCLLPRRPFKQTQLNIFLNNSRGAGPLRSLCVPQTIIFIESGVLEGTHMRYEQENVKPCTMHLTEQTIKN